MVPQRLKVARKIFVLLSVLAPLWQIFIFSFSL